MNSIRQRLEEFFRRLAAAPAARDRDEALRRIAWILTAVEDELSGIREDPNPPPKPTDGRLHPPRSDRMYEVPGRPAVKRLRSRGHNIFVGENGAIEILALDGTLEISKPGADARSVEDL